MPLNQLSALSQFTETECLLLEEEPTTLPRMYAVTLPPAFPKRTYGHLIV